MKKYILIDNEGYARQEIQAKKNSEARYKILQSENLPTTKEIKVINGTMIKIHPVSIVYGNW